jgi:hypothetical protein
MILDLVIWSHFKDQTWAGRVEIAFPPSESNVTTPEAVNERIFDLFNVKDEEDIEFLKSIGYDLPSLSVGDVVTWGDRSWRVATVGFKDVNEEPSDLDRFLADITTIK